MSRSKTLLFILSVLVLLAALWYVFPQKGVELGGVKLRFPNYESYLAELQDTAATVNVDSVLLAVQKSYEMPEGSRDTLRYYYDYINGNPNRISLPGGDYTFFDPLFEAAGGVAGHEEDSGTDRAAGSVIDSSAGSVIDSSADSSTFSATAPARTVRILHYGDSQLEMDRISAVLREKLQQRFGGSGPGMVPMVQRIPTVSLSQSASGNLTRYAMVGDSLTRKAEHKRYGPLTQFTLVSGNGSFSFTRTKNRYSQERVKSISRVSVLLGQNSEGFAATLKCDTLPSMSAQIDSAGGGVSLLSWDLPSEAERGSISFEGDAEIYGIALDDRRGGITVDNVALRGSAGYIFSSIDRKVMRESFALTDTRLIILQFGGNAVPGLSSRKGISAYVRKIVSQFGYFREVAPQARLMFIGPADMCTSIDGETVTWPLLPELNDSLRVNCLKNGVAYWDTFSVMGGAGSMKKWAAHSPALGGPDLIHFTHRGAVEIGNALSSALLLYHDFYLLRRELSDERVAEYMEQLRREDAGEDGDVEDARDAEKEGDAGVGEKEEGDL
ncbi:MAG: hypothetical protein Q4B16_05410 [Bacteroidia bacterium]|nr:hypothetical protein [Bacteroidia bacterium]